jgi:hypothetical protein
MKPFLRLENREIRRKTYASHSIIGAIVIRYACANDIITANNPIIIKIAF